MQKLDCKETKEKKSGVLLKIWNRDHPIVKTARFPAKHFQSADTRETKLEFIGDELYQVPSDT